MTPNQRIALNIVATYGRSLFALVCGLLTGRWLLMVLGTVDYGLYGLIAGLTSFITFFCGFLSGSVARYYAFSLGESQASLNPHEGLENCRRWFNTALVLHVLVPSFSLSIGYPLGVYAIENWLTIPVSRVDSCLWVFRFVCLSCFVGIVNVPYNAMYVAKQYIAELTIYSIAQTCCNIAILAFMLRHSGDWLARYAGIACLISVVPQILIMLRARVLFPECRIHLPYWRDFSRLQVLFQFAGWQLFGNLGMLLRTQGTAIFLNKVFGPILNTALGIGSSVTVHANQLTGAMNSALIPVVTSLRGAGQDNRSVDLTYRMCKFGVIFSLLFVLPLILERDLILKLWLKNPPPYVSQILLFLLIIAALDESVRGIGILVTASGKLARFHLVLGGLNVLSIPLIGAMVFLCWKNYLMVFLTLLIVQLISVILAVLIAQKVVGVSFRHWLTIIFIPVALSALFSFGTGLIIQMLFKNLELVRLLVCSFVVSGTFGVCAYAFILDDQEREFISDKIRRIRR